MLFKIERYLDMDKEVNMGAIISSIRSFFPLTSSKKQLKHYEDCLEKQQELLSLTEWFEGDSVYSASQQRVREKWERYNDLRKWLDTAYLKGEVV